MHKGACCTLTLLVVSSLMLQCYRKRRTMSTQRTSVIKFKDLSLLQLCLPRASHWAFSGFISMCQAFIFFLRMINLTEQEFQFPPTGTGWSNKKRTRSSSEWIRMYGCQNISSAFTKQKPRLLSHSFLWDQAHGMGGSYCNRDDTRRAQIFIAVSEEIHLDW